MKFLESFIEFIPQHIDIILFLDEVPKESHFRLLQPLLDRLGDLIEGSSKEA